MLRRTWIAIPALAVGVLLALLAGASSGYHARAALADDLPADGMSREEMAGLYGAHAAAQFQPPACVAGQEMFTDVPATHPFCAWIEELVRRGITTGCGATTYCPGNPVNRAQIAAFVVRSMEACPTMDPTDEMVRVGGICIDKYEASIWNAPVGGSQITGAIPCDANGQNCDNIYARSVAGVQPRRSITWFQAQAALANSGKRLPTNAEWQMAVRGTPDSAACNVNSIAPANTGSFGACVSDFGAFDMVGNLWEWVADWGDDATICTTWPSTYGSDVSCVGLGEGETNSHLPGALIRGGVWGGGADAGPFAVSGGNQPSDSFTGIGFRGGR